MLGKILIVDDVATNRIVFKVKLAAAGYQAVMASSGVEALRLARTERPDIILLDLFLQDMTGIDVLQALKAGPVTARIPVVMVSSDADSALRIESLRQGAEDFMARPIDDQRLLARLRGILRSNDALSGGGELQALGLAEPSAGFVTPGLVGLIMPRNEQALHLRRELQVRGEDRFQLVTPEQVYGLMGPKAPDVFLIHSDLYGPGSGLRMMSDLLSRTDSRSANFCIWLDGPNPLEAASAFDLGANDVVEAGMDLDEVALRLNKLVQRKRERDRMRATVNNGLRLAMFDPLTGIHNRRYATIHLNAVAERAKAEREEFAVMVLDIDRFKSVNDRYGHAAGDAVLVEVAARLSANLRGSDILARIGGEEFLAVLPGTELGTAQGVAERLCRAIESEPIRLPDGGRIHVTISIGMTTGGAGPSDPASVADLVDQADRALMHSKTHGRNQVTIVRSAA